ERAERLDPGDALLHRARIRRLEGEAIRDAMLAVSGRLSDRMFGPSVPAHLGDFQQGRGRPERGPVDGDRRRPLYLSLRRTFLPCFLTVSAPPAPFSPTGSRATSNVPAQALALLNDPLTGELARAFAARVLALPGGAGDHVNALFRAALGRPAEE